MKQTEPLLSVVIPVYNAEKYIEQCLTSVWEQKISALEVICVDDGSTDRSVERLEQLAAQHPELIILRQSNLSAGAARNNGLNHAKGKYVHFLDADDWLNFGIYTQAIKRMEETQADVCMFQYFFYDNISKQKKACSCLLNGRERLTSFREESKFFLYNMVAPWNKLYRRNWLEDHKLRFDEIVCGNDRGFYFRMLAAGGKIALLMEHGIYYRVKNVHSLTGSNRWQHFDSLFFAWDTSVQAMEKEKPAVRAMLLDCIVKDVMNVYYQAPREKQKELIALLGERFRQTDFSDIEALPLPCVWYRNIQLICDGKDPLASSKRISDRMGQIFAHLKIWGLRGCIVKANQW